MQGQWDALLLANESANKTLAESFLLHWFNNDFCFLYDCKKSKDEIGALVFLGAGLPTANYSRLVTGLSMKMKGF